MKSDAIINYLNGKKAHIAFMLWGSHAQKKGARIDKKVKKKKKRKKERLCCLM
jgi:uracil DNA glycosylase